MKTDTRVIIGFVLFIILAGEIFWMIDQTRKTDLLMEAVQQLQKLEIQRR